MLPLPWPPCGGPADPAIEGRHPSGRARVGRLEEAAREARQALDLARPCGERGHETWGLCLLDEIAAHPERLDAGAAEARYREAVALHATFGMRPLAAHCYLGLGTLCRAL